MRTAVCEIVETSELSQSAAAIAIAAASCSSSVMSGSEYESGSIRYPSIPLSGEGPVTRGTPRSRRSFLSRSNIRLNASAERSWSW
ncbi:Uncharacterised protein [Mycobacteroides abscessus subsp. abscessus]|nr:Uncharacterised protein [Mycobacteroides abscessus subsp. abscessus]